MLPWKLRKRQILPVSQNLSSVYFSLARFQLVSCNLSLALTWQMTYTHKLPKLCSTTLTCKGRFRCTKITVCRLLRLREEFYEFLACEQALRGAYWHAWRWGGELAHGLFKSSTPIWFSVYFKQYFIWPVCATMAPKSVPLFMQTA